MAISLSTAKTWLTGKEDLAQSIQLYFRTPKGSICLHPELGFGIFDYVDRNPNAVLKLILEVRNGLALWDSRINVIKTQPFFTMGKLKMVVKWSPVENDGLAQTTTVQL